MQHRQAVAAWLALGTLCLLAAQAAPWMTVGIAGRPAFTFQERAWAITAEQAFNSEGSTFASHAWLDPALGASPALWAIRLAGPLLALATLGCAVAAWQAARPRQAVPRVAAWWALAAAGAAALAATLLLAGLQAYNEAAGGRIAWTTTPAIAFAPLGALLCAAAGAVVLRTVPRRTWTPAQGEAWPPPRARAATGGAGHQGAARIGWRPPPGYDPATGLFVGDGGSGSA